jgi:hypothetical protein
LLEYLRYICQVFKKKSAFNEEYRSWSEKEGKSV